LDRLAGAFEAVMLREDAREGRQDFLGAIFVIAGEEDDVTAHARSVHALKYEGRSAAERSDGNEEREEECFHALRCVNRGNGRADAEIR
jgi:hypothetical protein